jgi:hypothetical protein
MAYPHIPVIVAKNITVSIEPHANVLWVHCKIGKWTAQTMRSGEKAWNAFVATLGHDLYVLRDPERNVPSKAFIGRFGFAKHRDIVGKDGRQYQVWKRGK